MSRYFADFADFCGLSSIYDVFVRKHGGLGEDPVKHEIRRTGVRKIGAVLYYNIENFTKI